MQCQRPRLARQALEAETGESVGLSVLPTRACAVVHQLKAQPLRREAVANTKPAGRPSFGGRRTARGPRFKGERCERVSRSCPSAPGAAARLGREATTLLAVIASVAKRGLTLRSRRQSPARHLAREPVVLIIGLAGQAPSRRLRLSSNVRPQMNTARCEG